MSGDLLSQSLQFVKGVGPRRSADLARVGLLTVEDLLLRFPLRYEDRAGLPSIAALRQGHTATVVGEVLSSGIRPTRRPGFRLFEVVVRDSSGAVRAVFPNQSFLKDVFKPQQQIVLYGPPEYPGGGLQITTPIAQRSVDWRMLQLPIYLFSDDTFKTKLYVDRISRIKEIKTSQSAGRDPVLFNLPPRLYLPRDADGRLVSELSGERQLPDLSWQDPAPGPNHLGDALKNAIVQFEFLRPRLEATKRAAAARAPAP